MRLAPSSSWEVGSVYGDEQADWGVMAQTANDELDPWWCSTLFTLAVQLDRGGLQPRLSP